MSLDRKPPCQSRSAGGDLPVPVSAPGAGLLTSLLQHLPVLSRMVKSIGMRGSNWRRAGYLVLRMPARRSGARPRRIPRSIASAVPIIETPSRRLSNTEVSIRPLLREISQAHLLASLAARPLPL